MFYARINSEGICDGIIESQGKFDGNPNMIEISSYDDSLLFKKRVEDKWEVVPIVVSAIPPIIPKITNEQLFAELVSLKEKIEVIKTDVTAIKSGKTPVAS